jgi:dipeptidyl aminopeptidase/acylaminoacyl peptidase
MAALPLAACRSESAPAAPVGTVTASAAPPPPAIDEARLEGHETLKHPQDAAREVEWIWRKPAGPGPFPAVLLVHGHQIGERPGADQWVQFGRFDEIVRDGIVAVAVSQPGYGKSSGPPDYCGPFTQEATRAVLAEMRRMRFIDSKRIALEGASRGAIVAGMVAAREPALAALILIAGPYDLVREYEALKSATTDAAGIPKIIERETGGASNEALRARSVLYVASQIKIPTLIMNGEKDDRTDPTIATQLGEEINAAGGDARTIIVPGAGHLIRKRVAQEERSFLMSRLRL